LEQPKDKTKKKKPRWKKLLRWLIVDLLVAAIFVLLLLYKPGQYHPIIAAMMDPNGQRVHPYLARELMPQFNNGIQARRPFRMKIVDKTLNEVIAQYKWPQEAAGVSILSPEVLFEPDRIILMGTANVEGADLIVTVELQPQFNEQGLLNLKVEKVKIGAMNITPLARMIGRRRYDERVEAGGFDPEDLRSQIAASLLSGRPFDPVIEYDRKKVRLKSAEVSQGQLDVEFVPAK
jgi:hypothetical protein